jgi:radical SAM enzyme (TIGR01210 family)
VLARRGPKAALDPHCAYATVWEEEPDDSGALAPTAVIFLTNRECPFRCVMCDLWVNTLDETVPAGAIPAQIRAALAQLPPARQVKVYNAGSFFDPRAIPPSDDAEIAREVGGFDRVIVESHPAFLAGEHGERCLRFRDRLRGRLEVAIGLETAHPEVLARLNKRMTIESFQRAARFLADHDVALRVFVLVNPPFLRGAAAVEWACRSIDVAAACGATAVSVIPTRSGNGAVEALGGDYEAPTLAALEAVLDYGLQRQACCADEEPGSRNPERRRLRVFADLWDVARFFDCACSPGRAARLDRMNRTQQVAPRITCHCDNRV